MIEQAVKQNELDPDQFLRENLDDELAAALEDDSPQNQSEEKNMMKNASWKISSAR